MSIRKKSSRISTSVKIDLIRIITDQNLIVEIRNDMDITTNNFGTPTRTTAKETAIEASTNETINTAGSGEMIDGDLAFGGEKNNSVSGEQVDAINFDFIEQKPITVVAQAIDTDATVDVLFKWREEW